MKKYYLIGLMSAMLSLLTGCQSVSGDNSFLGSFVSSDESINTAVNTAFVNNDQLAALPIHTETVNGTVLLTGYVKTIRQSDVAGDIASKVAGVKAVENNLIVRK